MFSGFNADAKKPQQNLHSVQEKESIPEYPSPFPPARSDSALCFSFLQSSVGSTHPCHSLSRRPPGMGTFEESLLSDVIFLENRLA